MTEKVTAENYFNRKRHGHEHLRAVNGHLPEHDHIFIKDGRVVEILVFDISAHDTTLMDDIVEQRGYDEFICGCEYGSRAKLHAEWNGERFTDPTQDYLHQIGLSDLTQADLDLSAKENWDPDGIPFRYDGTIIE